MYFSLPVERKVPKERHAREAPRCLPCGTHHLCARPLRPQRGEGAVSRGHIKIRPVDVFLYLKIDLKTLLLDFSFFLFLNLMFLGC